MPKTRSSAIHAAERAALLLAAAALAAMSLVWPARSEPVSGDVARGKAAFEICRPCHDVGRGAENRTGPHLNGLFGRRAGHVEGYASSLPMLLAGERGLVWDDETLARYLEDPQGLVPDSDMPLIGVFDATERADLIAFLHFASEKGAEVEARPRALRHERRPIETGDEPQ